MSINTPHRSRAARAAAVALFVWCGIAILAEAPLALAAGCSASDGSCTEWVTVGEGQSILVHRTHALETPDAELMRAVLVVHGTNSDADDYFSRMLSATDDAGVSDETLVIAPRFRHSAGSAEPGEIYWLNDSGSGHSWKQGDPSQGPGAEISSFEVMDRLVEAVADTVRFPNLRVITLVGHSAGGQFVQRYAVGGVAPMQSADHRFALVVANPSSFMYLDALRPLPGSTTEFAVPDTTCSYDRYKYGMQQRNEYMSRFSPSELRSQFVDRFVTYLAGELDTDVDGSNLDTSCRAELQGPQRYARAVAYANHLAQYYPGNFHRLLSVPGVGHSSSSMFRSPQGLAAIFVDESEIPVTNVIPETPQNVALH